MSRDRDYVTIAENESTTHTTHRPSDGVPCVLCVLCVVVLFPVVEGPCKRYAMARHVCQATTAVVSPVALVCTEE
jgi:hypothetical protein